ncbi:zinc metallo proteinase [Plectosphaerella plurivora]|uniref:Zinc metallo proteinase n=1 Tax=Plectosphaerella plurivora TaxID=936078 RepID=A0A9P9A7H6_9PEZI|nr:zinc metallo proteinase [Plectosphaerella plurivora]
MTDASDESSFPVQSWPIADGLIKMIVLLSPGLNKITIERIHGEERIVRVLNLTYVPLLQSPPLHLAIMVAKDSPLLIDCPPGKYASISTGHSSIDAAIAKFRMTAYMWQALTAEDMRMKGLGRRSFRFEEEWAADTTSREFVQGAHESVLHETGAMRSTAKIHIIKSDRTVAEIRDENVAQQNPRARHKTRLFDWFLQAIDAHGSPLESSGRPIVAGLILDSHFSSPKDMILGHAALGSHQPVGVSLGMMGSHLTYAWPRFLEEVSSCLLDTRVPGTTVGNDNGECSTFWEACAIGQGAFLHEVGHAFGAPHTTGIMARGYARHWPRNFVVRTAYCGSLNQKGFVVVDGQTDNFARWDMGDALSFRVLPHFWLPGDQRLSVTACRAAPVLSSNETDDELELVVSCESGIIQIEWNDEEEPTPSLAAPAARVTYEGTALKSRFDRAVPLKLKVLGFNGKTRVVPNAWRVLSSPSSIRIPGIQARLQKRSVMTKDLECGKEENMDQFWTWATLLTRREEDGIHRVSKVDVRTGCYLDGAIVHFPTGDRVNCGPRVSKRDGRPHSFGGHAAESICIPLDQEIFKVEVSREENVLRGMRLHLTNGTAGGALSGGGDSPETLSLEPQRDERIVGFFGRSWWGEHFDCLVEFGIITAPRDLVLPDVVYDMEELQNTDGGQDLNERKSLYGDDDSSEDENSGSDSERNSDDEAC